jgi:hypothetical protein
MACCLLLPRGWCRNFTRPSSELLVRVSVCVRVCPCVSVCRVAQLLLTNKQTPARLQQLSIAGDGACRVHQTTRWHRLATDPAQLTAAHAGIRARAHTHTHTHTHTRVCAHRYTCALSQYPVWHKAQYAAALKHFPRCDVQAMREAIGPDGVVLIAPGGNWCVRACGCVCVCVCVWVWVVVVVVVVGGGGGGGGCSVRVCVCTGSVCEHHPLVPNTHAHTHTHIHTHNARTHATQGRPVVARAQQAARVSSADGVCLCGCQSSARNSSSSSSSSSR